MVEELFVVQKALSCIGRFCCFSELFFFFQVLFRWIALFLPVVLLLAVSPGVDLAKEKEVGFCWII